MAGKRAHIAHADGSIATCRSDATGQLRIVLLRSDCQQGETLQIWNHSAAPAREAQLESKVPRGRQDFLGYAVPTASKVQSVPGVCEALRVRLEHPVQLLVSATLSAPS